MTLKQLKQHYEIFYLKEDGGICLYDKNQKGMFTASKYVGTIYKVGKNKWTVKGNLPFKNIEQLKEQLIEFAKQFPYDVEYYNPMYREGFTEESIVYHQLRKLNYTLSHTFGMEHAHWKHDALVKDVYISYDQTYAWLTHHTGTYEWERYTISSFEDVIRIAKELIIEAIKEQDNKFQTLKQQFGL